jgi:hypothetical protein
LEEEKPEGKNSEPEKEGPEGKRRVEKKPEGNRRE